MPWLGRKQWPIEYGRQGNPVFNLWRDLHCHILFRGIGRQ